MDRCRIFKPTFGLRGITRWDAIIQPRVILINSSVERHSHLFLNAVSSWLPSRGYRSQHLVNVSVYRYIEYHQIGGGGVGLVRNK